VRKGVAGATNKELRGSDGRETVSAQETESGANVPMNREAQADSQKIVFHRWRDFLTPKNFGLCEAQIETPRPRPVGGSSDSDLLLWQIAVLVFWLKFLKALRNYLLLM